jgi:hypothetical protein
MLTLQPSADLIQALDAAVRQAIQTLSRIMDAALRIPGDQPLPKPLTQARLAATQVLRFAARVVGDLHGADSAHKGFVERPKSPLPQTPPVAAPAAPASFVRLPTVPVPFAGMPRRAAARIMASAGTLPKGVPVAAA